ncbi:hypothetical protein [Bremerella cremea]|nr:hypothetical protein [Bremerella cremea]
MPRKYIYASLIVGIAILLAAILGNPAYGGMAFQRLTVSIYLMLATVGIVVGLFGNPHVRPGAMGLGIFGILYFFFFEVFLGQGNNMYRSSNAGDFLSERVVSYCLLLMAGLISQLLGMLLAPSSKAGTRKLGASSPHRPPEPPCPLD